MEYKLTFRNTERKDTGLILQFIKELLDYEKKLASIAVERGCGSGGALTGTNQTLIFIFLWVQNPCRIGQSTILRVTH